MSSVKVAVSLPEELLERVEALAKGEGVPPGQIVAAALEEYVTRRENRRLALLFEPRERD